LSLRRDALVAGLVCTDDRRDEIRAQRLGVPLQQPTGECVLGLERQPKAESELGVVLEQRVGPGRSPAVMIGCVRRRGQVAPINRRAAGGVGDQQAVAKQLGQQLDVRRLAATGTSARVLEQGTQQLRALDVAQDLGPLELGKTQEECVALALLLEPRALRLHLERLVARVALILGGAYLHAKPAAGAVLGSDLDGVALTAELLAAKLVALKTNRRVRQQV